MNSKGFRTVMMICLWIVLAFMYIPIIAIIGMSFNATKYGMFPYVFTTKWYTTLFTTSNLLPAALFSLRFAFLVTIAAVILGTLCAYGLQYYAPKWAARFNFVLQLPIIIPWLVTAISLLLLFSFIGSGRSYVAMFLGNLIVVLPYVVLLVNGRFVEMDRTPESAALLLGASPVRVFFDITLPAILPGMLAGGPNSDLEDPFAANVLRSAAPARCYADSDQSFSTNEVTVYWNSPLIALLSAAA